MSNAKLPWKYEIQLCIYKYIYTCIIMIYSNNKTLVCLRQMCREQLHLFSYCAGRHNSKTGVKDRGLSVSANNRYSSITSCSCTTTSPHCWSWVMSRGSSSSGKECMSYCNSVCLRGKVRSVRVYSFKLRYFVQALLIKFLLNWIWGRLSVPLFVICYISHSTVETCFAEGLCLFKQP